MQALIIIISHFKIRPGMGADRADLRRFRTHMNMPAVRANPNNLAVLSEHPVVFYIFQ